MTIPHLIAEGYVATFAIFGYVVILLGIALAISLFFAPLPGDKEPK